MTNEAEMLDPDQAQSATPSADLIQAISLVSRYRSQRPSGRACYLRA